MTDAADSVSPAHYSFRPASAEALWQQISTPRPTAGKARRLGEALVHAGLLTAPGLWHGLQVQQQEREKGQHRPIGQILVELGALTQEQLRAVIASWLGEYQVHPGDLKPEAAALALVPRAMAERESGLPLLIREDTLVLLMIDPGKRSRLDELRFLTQRRLIALQAAPDTLGPAIRKAYQPPGTGTEEEPAPVVRSTLQELLSTLDSTEPGDANEADALNESDTLAQIINAVIDEAIGRNASDIHIETELAPKSLRIRLRIDGDLATHLELPARYRVAVVARIKVMAGMDTSERRKPQEGKIDFARFGGPPVELRVTSIPTSQGLEDVVLRLLTGVLALDRIDLSRANLLALQSVAQKRYGLLLVCGPTGCGKTTTLHSVLRDINGTGRKIWTAEDPIEITHDGLRQVQVTPRLGWTVAAAMRAFLRADPDVIMVDEMRDEEIARIALEAAFTGHLVLTTLLTTAAPDAVARQLGQLDIKLNPLDFSALPLAILAQRLVLRLCVACRESQVIDQDRLMDLASQYLESGSGSNTLEARTAQVERWRLQHGDAQGALRLWRHKGCAECQGFGYQGRLGIHGLMVRDEPANWLTLRQDGIEKVLQGLTDMAQVLAATDL